MSDCRIDNLEDWQTALDKLQQIRNECILDGCQVSLVRILGYRENWRLRERALEYAADVKNPGVTLLEVILSIMVDENTYVNARILAAEALRVLVPRYLPDTEASSDTWKASLITTMKEILSCPQAPLFYAAVTDALREIDSGQQT